MPMARRLRQRLRRAAEPIPPSEIDSTSTVYYCYVNSEANGLEGHVHVAVWQAERFQVMRLK